jgi:threonine dehydratase
MTGVEHPGSSWPIAFADVLAAEGRIRECVPETPLRRYAPLDAEVGGGIGVWVKHENHAPTNSFKIRNALSVMTRLSEEDRRRGVVAATRGNHGLGVSYAGAMLGVPVTICVPRGNNPEKNEGMRGYGAELIEEGRDYDESVAVAERLVRERGLRMIHSTNDSGVVAGAGTLTLEILRARPELDALVLSVGGGSQAVGALTVARTLKPRLAVYGVQAAGAPAAHDSWHAGRPMTGASANTFADGLATRSIYTLTFGALRDALADFLTVTDAEIAEAVRILLRTTHNLAEGAGAAGLAGLLALRDRLAGKCVGIVISGGNIDRATLARVVNREL